MASRTATRLRITLLYRCLRRPHTKRPNLILTRLNVATHAGQINMPGMRFHPLKGGRFSVWVDESYRMTFKFENGLAYELDCEDYH